MKTEECTQDARPSPGWTMISPLHVVLAVVFVDAIGVGIIIPVLPDLILELTDHNSSQVAWYVGLAASAYAAMQLLCAPLAGRLSDRYGRRVILIACMFALAFDSLFQALAVSVSMLLVGRIVAGVAAASVATANAFVANMSLPQERVKNFGLVGATYGLGLIFGPALGAVLGLIHLRLPLFFLAMLSLCAAFALIAFTGTSFTTPMVVYEDQDSPEPLTPFRSSYLRYIMAAVLCSSLAQRGLENLFVLYTELRFDWSRAQAGLSLCLLGLMAVLAQGFFAGPLVARLGSRLCVLLALGSLALTMIGFFVNSIGILVYPLFLIGAFSGIAGPALQSFLADRIDSKHQGQAQGIFVSIVSFSSLVAPLLFTSFIFRNAREHAGILVNSGTPFLVGAGFIVLSMILVSRGFLLAPASLNTSPLVS